MSDAQGCMLPSTHTSGLTLPVDESEYPGEQGMWVERKGNTGKREGGLKLMTGVGLGLGELKFRIYFAMYSVLI